MACNEHDTKSKTDTAQSEQQIEWNERDSNNATDIADEGDLVQRMQQMRVIQFNRYSR